MGLAKPDIYFLTQELDNMKSCKSVLQLGKQDIYFSFEELQEEAEILNFKLHSTNVTKKINPWTKKLVIDDVTFFKSLGCDNVESMDVSGYEDASYIYDLNDYPPAEHLKSKFNLIIDGGTSEHIFNIPNVLKNIHFMLSEFGTIVHKVPISNMVDHGFYSFSPTLFADYYAANNYEIINNYIIGTKLPYGHNADVFLMKYDPELVRTMSIGGFTKENFKGCEMFSLYFSARKNRNSTSGVVPQQGAYAKDIWNR